MTIADGAAAALVARGIATGTRLGQLTLMFHDDLGVPAVVDRETNTIWINTNEPLEDVIFMLYSCFDELVGGTIVQTEDGELAVVPDLAVGAEHLSRLPGQEKPNLHVVR